MKHPNSYLWKPMLAASETLTFDTLSDLSYPVLVTEKLDGIRMLCAPFKGKMIGYSRRHKPIRNLLIQQWVEDNALPGMDGEIILKPSILKPVFDFSDIQSFVMSQLTLPKPWEYCVFDQYWGFSRNFGYQKRLQALQNQWTDFGSGSKRLKILSPLQCDSAEELGNMFNQIIDAGGEGLIIRSWDGLYKQGRATINEATMLKMKLFEDAEGIVTDFIPEYENLNEQKSDELGYAKRSSHNINLRPRARLGALIVYSPDTKETFQVGSGFSHDTKTEIWKNRHLYKGKTITFKFQRCGTKFKPRTPIFKSFRKD